MPVRATLIVPEIGPRTERKEHIEIVNTPIVVVIQRIPRRHLALPTQAIFPGLLESAIGGSCRTSFPRMCPPGSGRKTLPCGRRKITKRNPWRAIWVGSICPGRWGHCLPAWSPVPRRLNPQVLKTWFLSSWESPAWRPKAFCACLLQARKKNFPARYHRSRFCPRLR